MSASDAGRSQAGPFSIGSDTWPGVSKVIEECGELGQVLGKLIALGGEVKHWDGSDLRKRLHQEVADVQAALAFLVQVNRLDKVRIDERAYDKQALFLRWHEEQRLTADASDQTP